MGREFTGESAFVDAYSEYFDVVYREALRYSGNHHVAEEIAQETFVKALKSLNQFDGRKDIRAWLFTIAKNTYFSYCRRKKHDADWTEYENIVDVGVHFAENLVNEEKAFLIHKFLHNMEEPYKEVFNLRVFGELSYEKIGTLFQKSSGWVRVTFYRAKKKIEEYMEEQGYE